MSDHIAIQSFAQADLVLLTASLMSAPQRHTPNDSTLCDDAIHDLAAAASCDLRLVDSLHLMHEHCLAADINDWQWEYTRLFDGHVACPINETAFVRRDKGVIISDICGFYRAFGFEPNNKSGEKADHLVCELEFIAVLLVMLGEAERADDTSNATIVESALRSFLSDHLGDWIALFAQHLKNTTKLPLFLQVASFLGDVWNTLAQRFEQPDFASLNDEVEISDWEDDDTPYECGMAEAEQSTPFVELTGPQGSGLPMRPGAADE